MNIGDYGPKLTAQAFLEIDFGERIKAELEAGEIKPVERGPSGRVSVAGNALAFLSVQIRGTGKRAYGPSLALMTSERSVRYPDVAVYDHHNAVHSVGERDLMIDPIAVLHVLSDPDRSDRLANEYRHIRSLQSVLLINHERERVRALTRAGDGSWHEVDYADRTDIAVPSLNLTIPHAEIFARD